MMRSPRLLFLLSALAASWPGVANASNYTAQILLEGGLGSGIGNVESISAVRSNSSRGYAATVVLRQLYIGGPPWEPINIHHPHTVIWGSAAGEPGHILAEPSIVGTMSQTSFEDAAFGLASPHVSETNIGVKLAVSANMLPLAGWHPDDMVGFVDSYWMHDTLATPEFKAMENLLGPQVPATINGQTTLWRTFSRVGCTAGGTPYFLAGLTDAMEGRTKATGLYYGTAPVIKSGDPVASLGVNVAAPHGIGDFAFSPAGGYWIAVVHGEGLPSDANEAVLLSGATGVSALQVAGQPVVEGALVAAPWALSGETWEQFRFVRVNEFGESLLVARTESPEGESEIIVVNGQLLCRSGTSLDGEELSGSVQHVALNDNRDVVHVWDIRDGTAHGMFLNGQLLLARGDPIDYTLSSGSLVQVALLGFVGLNRVSMTGRTAEGDVDVIFAGNFQPHDQSGASRLCLVQVTGNTGGTAVCPADRNGDGITDVFDLLDFLDLWFAYDPSVDENGDGVVDVYDLLDYLDRWFLGCI